MNCAIPGCDGTARARDLCWNHYQHAWRRGLLAPLKNDKRKRRRALSQIVMPKIVKQPDGCWRWTGYVRPNGYGIQHVANMPRQAHRVVYELLVGPIPDGMTLDHMCHDPQVCRLGKGCPHRRCVNPEHMAVVTHEENCSRVYRRPKRVAS